MECFAVMPPEKEKATCLSQSSSVTKGDKSGKIFLGDKAYLKPRHLIIRKRQKSEIITAKNTPLFFTASKNIFIYGYGCIKRGFRAFPVIKANRDSRNAEARQQRVHLKPGGNIKNAEQNTENGSRSR